MIRILDGEQHRSYEKTDFPLIIGGPESCIPGEELEAPLAYLGLDEDQVFIQAEADSDVVFNGEPLSSSRWLKQGDQIQFGDLRLQVAMEDEQLALKVTQGLQPVATVPILTPPPREEVIPEEPEAPQEEEDVAFVPRKLEQSKRGRAFTVIVAACTLLMVVVVGFLIVARSVTLEIRPVPDSLSISGKGFPFKLGGRYLVLPGEFTIKASKKGYYPLEAPIEVGEEAAQKFQLTLDKLPGYLKIATVDGASITIGDREVGTAPLDPIELSAGEHLVKIEADRHEPYAAWILIQGTEKHQDLVVELKPLWASVSFNSSPPGATVLVDGEELGQTPLQRDLLAGAYRIDMIRAGYKLHRQQVRVQARQPLEVPTVKLIPADGNLTLVSEPDGVAVSVNGAYKGKTPLDLTLKPGVEHKLTATMQGFRPLTRSLRIRSGESREERLRLDAKLGDVIVKVWPKDAELLINDVKQKKASGSFSLPALPTNFTLRKTGFVPVSETLTPLPGVPKTIDVKLKTVEQHRVDSIKDVILSSRNHRLKLIQPGSMRLGASRREAGRRANETLREIELTRPYYLGIYEVTNAQFREFRGAHESGMAGTYSINEDNHPVARVTWQDAVAYCNWLSEQDGLQPFYVKKGNQWVAAPKPTTGYRLPSEAEWAWAARFNGGEETRKFPWGNSLPAPKGAGNYADASGGKMLPRVMVGYDDGFPASAPVGSFAANLVSIHDLGGNVAEWVHDAYVMPPPGALKPATDPMGDGGGELHVIRGSSWMHGTITQLRWSYRDYGEKPRPDVGFRIARYLEVP